MPNRQYWQGNGAISRLNTPWLLRDDPPTGRLQLIVTQVNKGGNRVELEHVCDMELAYQGAMVRVSPYGGTEAVGYGSGEGAVFGPWFQGIVRWTNAPHWRADGVMVANAKGVILLDTGGPILFHLAGQDVMVETEQARQGRQLFTAIFEVEDVQFRWLNTSICVAEARIHRDTFQLHLRIYACINRLREGELD